MLQSTLLALASKSIVMGCASELGPIEPLVGGVPCSILIEPKIPEQNFTLHKFAEYALSQSRKLAKTLLSEGMMDGKPEVDIETACTDSHHAMSIFLMDRQSTTRRLKPLVSQLST
jgi:hypothetical protein